MAYPTDYFPAPEIHVFTSKVKLRKFAKSRFGKHIGEFDTYGTTFSFENGGRMACLVYVSKNVTGARDKSSLLAHECLHVAYSWAYMLDKDEPQAEEFMSYAMQSAYLTCIDQLGEEWLS